jgi:tRNA (cytidine/uridine-2'-O-)-methyltransferase
VNLVSCSVLQASYMPFNVVLIAPEIPQNTGNIIRLCANTGARLHLVEPLGFDLTEKSLRRASLDYKDLVNVTVHNSFEAMMESIDPARVFAASARASNSYSQIEYHPDDTVIFGAEGAGLTDEMLSKFAPQNQITIPMMPANRSINLSNAVALVVYEMWRQQSFDGSEPQARVSEPYFS